MNNKLSKPDLIIHKYIELIEELINQYKQRCVSHIKDSDDIKTIYNYELLLKEFQDAEKAIVHANTIDKYIRETMIYPFNAENSQEISKRVLAFIRANRPLFIEGMDSEFLEKLQDNNNLRTIQKLSDRELQKIAGMIENEILKRNKDKIFTSEVD